MRAAFCAVALLAMACLLFRASRIGLAGDFVDPIGRITAQDEALYSNSAIRMVQQGGWLTPKFMGRFALYKPPLQLWASGISARLLGITRVGLRLPAALLCGLAVGCVFLWTAELRSWQAGVCAALLVTSNHLWHVLGSMNLTDGYVAAFYTIALYCLFSDPWLESRTALAGFAASVAAAILTKSVAGTLPLGMLAIYWVAAPRKQRPALSRVLLAAALSLALAAPWFLYQMAVHPRWFWAEHIGVEIVSFGAGAPPQTSHENPVLFYFLRATAMDPVLIALALLAVPSFLGALRQRSAEAVLLLSWLAVPLAAVLMWKYRNVSYLLPLVPALAILAGAYNPLAASRRSWPMLAVIAAALMAKLAMPAAPFGISFHTGTVQPQAAVLSDYCARGRDRELIVAGLDDDLYAAALPLAGLRYIVLAAAPAGGSAYGMPFAEMGITLSAAQFNDLPRIEPVFRERLRAWGLDSAEPIGTLILASSAEELGRVIEAHPGSDFLLPLRFRGAGQSTHDTLDAGDHFFLLSRHAQTRTPAWSCLL